MSESHKYVYKFGGGIAEGDRSMKSLLGGKGANLAEMSSIGLPVPPGFTISTEACKVYNEKHHEWPQGLEKQIQEGVDHLEKLMNAQLGDANEPLLVSVRSGAAISMPGMMDTVLNLGMNDDVVEGLAKKTNNERFAYDSYRRFIDMFGDVVMGVSHENFERSIEKLKKERNAEIDTDLSADDLKELVDRYKAVYRQHTGYMFPQDPKEQLFFAVNAVFDSWSSSRAAKYRKINKITGLLGTAVNVQAMVFGNMGDHSATGVCFTRNPATGNKELYGEYLVNAQGEDVVAGIRTPKPISQLDEGMPDSYKQLNDTAIQLEKHYKNMQDIEFTIQEGYLYILQTRNGKRTGPASLKIAVDMVDEKIATEADAISNLVEPNHVDQLLHPQLADSAYEQSDVLGTGLPASPGAAVGRVVFDSDEAEEWKEKGEDVILVRVETSPEDVGGMSAAKGILTSRGGMTSHAAVVARGWGKPCIAGCNEIVINYKKESFTNGTETIKKGDWISIDGAKGVVIKDRRQLHEPTFNDDYYRFMGWVDEIRKMQIRTNVDTPEDAKKAIEFGAEGIGLARTEHMFFGDERITSMRKMILSDSAEERQKALFEILPYQRGDFKGIFEAMGEKPVTVRLLDPPLHEFLPEDEDAMIQVADNVGISAKKLRNKINALKEHNPMLGHRGCRLGITYPEITIMQTRAVIEAAVELKQEGTEILPEIMIPLVGSKAEFTNQRAVVDDTAQEVFKEKGVEVNYKVGTMIEIPRAALLAEGIAEEAEFFSFGTNDLTQLTFGFSRDDVGKFLPQYISDKLLPHDPFQTLDQNGVGQLVTLGTERGRNSNPDIKVGICGEHGGDPESIDFFYKNNLNYVSCSPYRIPIARLSAAQSQLKTMDKTSNILKSLIQDNLNQL